MSNRRTLLALTTTLTLSTSSVALAQASTPASAPAMTQSAPALTAEQRAKYVGTFDLTKQDGGTMVVHILSASDRLRVAADGESDTLDLRHLAKDSFEGENGPPFRLTFSFENGALARLTVVDPQGNILNGTVRRPGAAAPASAAPAAH